MFVPIVYVYEGAQARAETNDILSSFIPVPKAPEIMLPRHGEPTAFPLSLLHLLWVYIKLLQNA